MNTRRHHYLSQFYLRGFTDGESKNSKLTVIDMENGRFFESPTWNVGALRDFNRIDAHGIDPNILEVSLSEFEAQAAKSLRNLKDGAPFEGEDKSVLLHMIAMFAIRTPARRESWRKFIAELAEHTMDLVLANKERYESQVQQARESGEDLDDVSYEEMKRFFDSKQYTVNVAREEHIRTEFIGIDAVLPYLFERRWFLVRASNETGPFITSDHPVSLTWINPDTVPVFHRQSPGYGLLDTRVCFPLSQNLALIGEFENDGLKGITDTFTASRSFVAKINGTTGQYALRQLYAPKLGFFVFLDNEIRDGRHLLKRLSERKT